MASNTIVSETLCTNTGLSGSQEDDFSLNAHKFIAVPAHIETENKSGSILSPAVSNGPHHSAIEVPDESNYRDSLVLPGNISHALNNNQEPDAVLLDADYHGYPLSNSVAHKFGHKISEESNSDDLKLNGVYPHCLVSFNGFPVQYVLKTVKLIVIMVYEDPTLFHGRTWKRKILKSRYQLRIFKKGRCRDIQ
ncbi:unnamed protein product [Schistosoma curassoni]|uniref:HSF_DOMAIN domain-containing protein n=1 Tax=Schistosoma curassoni TaxID=6186 RepID=A0A183KBG6_9TREM|nr:unnamed protein product [Schistosoma curassoni]